MENLAHSASFHSREKTAPSNPGIKHLVHDLWVAEGLVATGFMAGFCMIAACGSVGPNGRYRSVVWMLVALVLLSPVLNLLSGIAVPKLTDVATTTANVGGVMCSGENPYAADIDTFAVNLMHEYRFGGCKYLP